MRDGTSSRRVSGSLSPASGGSRWNTRRAVRFRTSLAWTPARSSWFVSWASRWCRRAISSSVSRPSGTPMPSPPTAGVGKALTASRIGRSKPSRAQLARRRRRRPSTTSSSSWRAGFARKGSSAIPIRTCRRERRQSALPADRRGVSSRPSRPDELVLLDLWGKLDRPGAVFADITWVGYTGARVPDQYARAFARRGRGARRGDRARAAGGRRRPGTARLAGGPRGLVRSAQRGLRRPDPAPHGPQPRRIRARQRRQHGRLRDARRSAAPRRHWLHDRTGRIFRRLRRSDGNQHDRRRRATRRSPDRCRRNSSHLARRRRYQAPDGGFGDVHAQDHALLRIADRGRFAGGRHGDRLAAGSDPELVGTNDRAAADEQRADQRPAGCTNLPQHRQGHDARGRQHPHGDEGQGAGLIRLLRRRRRRLARRPVPALLRRARRSDRRAGRPGRRGGGQAAATSAQARRRRAPRAPASSSARTASS